MWKLLAALVVCLVCAPGAHATFPGENGRLAFEGGPPNLVAGDLYSVNPDGSDIARLTSTSGARETFPDWSPDGARIVFQHCCFVPTTIDVMNADGSGRTTLKTGPVTAPGWSPDGTQIAYVANSSELRVMNADGSGDSLLLLDGAGIGFFRPRWSPDGSRIVFHGLQRRAIWTVQSDGGGLTALTGEDLNTYPDWSPDGSKIVFASRRDGGDGAEIYVMNADGTAESRLTNDPAGDSFPTWSPDGSRIAFTRNGELVTMAPDGSDVRRFGIGSAISPDWQSIPVDAYPRPKGATPFKVSLVPAFTACTAPDRTHGPPLAFGSCSAPAQASAELTVGTADSNAKPAKSRGFVLYRTLVGNPAAPADEADVGLTVELSDVYAQGTLDDYAGELGARTSLRITDKLNTPHPGGPGAGTVSDITLGATVPCTPTADTSEGAGCNLTTTFDSLVPGAVSEGRRSIWALGAVRLDDGGADGDADTTADNTPFMTQGLFVP
jgi:hypothetical protein